MRQLFSRSRTPPLKRSRPRDAAPAAAASAEGGGEVEQVNGTAANPLLTRANPAHGPVAPAASAPLLVLGALQAQQHASAAAAARSEIVATVQKHGRSYAAAKSTAERSAEQQAAPPATNIMSPGAHAFAAAASLKVAAAQQVKSPRRRRRAGRGADAGEGSGSDDDGGPHELSSRSRTHLKAAEPGTAVSHPVIRPRTGASASKRFDRPLQASPHPRP